MKTWPKDKCEVASFDDLCDPIVKAIRFVYKIERINDGKDVPWSGLPLEGHLLGGCIDAEEKLNASNLKYSEEDQGRDPLREIVALAVQLGICQGIRIQRKKVAQSAFAGTLKIVKRVLDNFDPSELQEL